MTEEEGYIREKPLKRSTHYLEYGTQRQLRSKQRETPEEKYTNSGEPVDA